MILRKCILKSVAFAAAVIMVCIQAGCKNAKNTVSETAVSSSKTATSSSEVSSEVSSAESSQESSSSESSSSDGSSSESSSSEVSSSETSSSEVSSSAVTSSRVTSSAVSSSAVTSSRVTSSRVTSSRVSSSAVSSSQVSSAVSSQQSSSAPVSTNGKINNINNIIDDMKKPHEGLPHGVPLSYDWSQRPRVGMGTTPNKGSREFKAMTAWGQLYEDSNGNPATNTRVQIRNIRAYYFSRSQNRWIELQSSMLVEGRAYVEDFQGDKNKSANVRSETNNGGGISVTAGNGYNFHFWPKSGRAEIDGNDIVAIYTTVQARLVVADKSKADDRAKARYLLGMGGDYWTDTGSGWNEFTTNGDFAIGRFKYVTNNWQAFNAWAGDESFMRQNPPPME